MISAEAAMRWNALVLMNLAMIPTTSYNSANVNDPVYTAMHEAAAAATTIEEYNRHGPKELDQYGIEKFWEIWGPVWPHSMPAIQPWLVGFNGETMLGTGQYTTIFSRLWIDSELKEAMGH